MLANTAGIPVTGLQAYFYAAGTLNPIPVFQESALAVEHIQPVTVDDAGRLPPIWLTQNLAYRIQLKDQFGALIENGDIDNYIEDQLVLSSAQIATTLDSLKRTSAEIAAGVTPINYAYLPGDVRRYGADPTGVVDATSQIQAALNSNYEVWLDGTFKASNLSMTIDGQRLYGVARGSNLVALNNIQPVITMTGNRQVIENIIFSTGGLATNDSQPAFNAVKIAGSRNLVRGIASNGIFTYGVRFYAALYSCLRDSNIDGYRKRAVSVEAGGTFNRIEDCMLFDGTAAAPADAIVYVDNSPSTSITDCHITRGLAPAIKATGIAPPAGFLAMLLTIERNDIDNLENWAIDIENWWDIHIHDNWCSGGQGASVTGQIRLTNCQKFYITSNDVYSALHVGSKGIYLDSCNFGEIGGNTVEYQEHNIEIEASNYITVHDNVCGQLTGLPPSGEPSKYCFVGVSLPASNHVQWVNNIAYQPVTADYTGIANSNIIASNIYSASASLGLLPTVDNAYHLGDGNLRWNLVQATRFYPGPGAAGVFWEAGTGSPEGVVTAPVGSLWSRTNGGATSSFYVKESGTGTTGWVAK
jgi:hypothetical protein